jgi:hypothetical protein
MKLNRIALKMEVDVKVQKTDATGCWNTTLLQLLHLSPLV